MIQQDVPLKEYSSFKIGGNAKYFLKVETRDQLIEGLKEWANLSKDFSDSEKKVFILGGGKNILISDNGFPGLVIYNNIKFIEREEEVINVGAGVLVEELLDYCIENSLSGLAWAGGLPGTVGGAIRGNAGAYGGEIKGNILSVESLNIVTIEIIKRNREECRFNYRDSVFKSGGAVTEIIISSRFSLEIGNADEIRKEVEDHISNRKKKHPLHLPNAGSIFKNVPLEKISEEILKQFEGSVKNDPFLVVPAAKIIAEAGIMGEKIGGAQISETHPNFIVNIEDATYQDVKDLIFLEQKTVKEKFGIELEPEIIFVE